jgi:hypothetical protein
VFRVAQKGRNTIVAFRVLKQTLYRRDRIMLGCRVYTPYRPTDGGAPHKQANLHCTGTSQQGIADPLGVAGRSAENAERPLGEHNQNNRNPADSAADAALEVPQTHQNNQDSADSAADAALEVPQTQPAPTPKSEPGKSEAGEDNERVRELTERLRELGVETSKARPPASKSSTRKGQDSLELFSGFVTFEQLEQVTSDRRRLRDVSPQLIRMRGPGKGATTGGP